MHEHDAIGAAFWPCSRGQVTERLLAPGRRVIYDATASPRGPQLISARAGGRIKKSRRAEVQVVLLPLRCVMLPCATVTAAFLRHPLGSLSLSLSLDMCFAPVNY